MLMVKTGAGKKVSAGIKYGSCHKLKGGDGVAVCSISDSNWSDFGPLAWKSTKREELRHAMQRGGEEQIYQVVSPKVLSTKNPYYKELVNKYGEDAEKELNHIKYIARGLEFYAKLSELKAWANRWANRDDSISIDANIDELIRFYHRNIIAAPDNVHKVIDLIEKWTKAYPEEQKKLKKKANDILPSLVTTQEPETGIA